MKLCIFGSRDRAVGLDAIDASLAYLRGGDLLAPELYGPVTLVISGGADGIDACGEYWAAAWQIPLRVMAADWKAHGKAAGPIRNGEMARLCDAALGWWNGTSPGTANMIGHLGRLDRPHRVVRLP